MSSPTGFSSATFPKSLYIATIVLYSILIVPTFYVWRRHGRPGFLAYNFIYAFCAIRIAGGALSIVATHDAKLETSATIVNSLAISPLILAGLGFLHEARVARIADLHSRREWVLVGAHHSIVTTAIVLVVIGIVNVVKGVSTTQNSGLIKGGLAMLVVSYAVLLVWTTISLRVPDRPQNVTFIDGTLLLHTTFATLPLIGMRLVYGVISFLLIDPAFARSLAAKVILGFLPELFSIMLFVYGGYRTRDMYASRHREISGKYSC
ncbi:hypothetical protein QM012_002952 [Aureobasidium pullulans]|uniref:DUF7702 domain-containing protein n=1 Tax=Aureobasidium pullulans TaxID=5580 RepID=A0ABR0TAZ4_AURPU